MWGKKEANVNRFVDQMPPGDVGGRERQLLQLSFDSSFFDLLHLTLVPFPETSEGKGGWNRESNGTVKVCNQNTVAESQ